MPSDTRPISTPQIKYLTELRSQIDLSLEGIERLSLKQAKKEIERLIRNKQEKNRRKGKS